MILVIFNKIIKNEKGGVQFIESAIIFPVLLLFLSLLFVISIKIFSASLLAEKSYVEGRKLLLKTKSDFRLAKTISKEEVLKTNLDLRNFSTNFIKDKIKLKLYENIFYNIVNINKNQELIISTKKIYQSDINRKLDFAKEILNDVKDVKFGKYTLSGIFDCVKGLADNIKNKMIK
ncbi:hypothetical protein ABGF49_01440 [Helcococcus ovis]|uniref:Uncharacterized protein n=1 Tax=Helcococcus ovis TaxID=72026 RepID=A0A4R9C0R8_9FIRM|nr:hypothetical protein [Helcococcus ovis]TFF63769.1 hypothetical protein EQF92_08270 [Helcococcus ovis]TFF64255.1 hypothetical protein EQF91_07950 [Helcococcus ovis]TFF66527.1 hypothetical protein EQF93_07090 [Helcococcus ovis]WNZ01683.1 hypothetical protein EQF90_002200 [Helcococcus ovis]